MAETGNIAAQTAKESIELKSAVIPGPKNVFTELFGQDVSQKESGLMNTVAGQQEKKGATFFGDKPKTDEILKLKAAPTHPNKIGSTFLKASLLILILTVVGFLSQNSARFSFFGVNPALLVRQSSEQVDEMNAEVRVQRHLAAALLLDQYSNLADEYFYDLAQASSAYVSANKRTEYKQDAEALKPELLALLADIQENLKEDIPNEEMERAKSTIETLKTELSAKTGTVDEQSLLQDLQDIETTLVIMRNQPFKTSIASLNLEAVTDAELQTVYEDFNTLNASVSALINNIKNARVRWSVYLDEIEKLIKKVDPLFNTEFPGNLTLDDVRFGTDGSVSVAGQSVTDDTKNFTLVSNLIDTFEASDYFANAQDRSFNKNDSSPEEAKYAGEFSITMQLEQ